jgi:hypothetical protein
MDVVGDRVIVVGADTELAVPASTPGIDGAVAREPQAVAVAAHHFHDVRRTVNQYWVFDGIRRLVLGEHPLLSPQA